MPLPATPSPSRRRTGAAPSPAPRSPRRHIAPLDGLRGIAVLGVLFFHAGHFDGGFLGVDLFFVLSGFLITGLLLEEARARDGRIDLVAFWGRRARRLLPALAVVLAGTLLLVWALGPPNLLRHALDDGPWVAANLANWHFVAERVGYWDSAQTRVFSHLWSIAVEEQFYAVWPLLLCLAARGRAAGRRVAAVAGAGAALSLALMIVLTAPADPTRVYEGTDTRAFSLLLGALAATPPATRLMSRAGERAAGRWSLLLAAGIGAYWIVADGQDSPSLFRGGLFLHALAAALLIALLVRAPRTPAGRLLAAAPLHRLGTISYSLYLWHWPVYLLLSEERLGLQGAGRTAVLLAASVALALLSKVLVEDPVRFRARWARGRTGAVALVAVFAALAALWAAVPQPRTGEGSVDVTRLVPDDG
ncbi:MULTISPECIES: acyltransferase [Streptomyces]|uniref:acyltransferase family protein n=1 Tax=Streptomyces TaxID=1883 RepID=UPI001CCFED78|nr:MULTISPECIES: acyltransferase [Streptomyces]MBZ6175411.1 acyltransferase [Streptomyces olivaceus]MBZ6182047.1 acyltransferase [Streptomyces olivaceus]WFB82064.1 acyltransferase [Streptomyces olivaceus]WGK44399.1 acyltransferase [Streptomyces sp. B146]